MEDTLSYRNNQVRMNGSMSSVSGSGSGGQRVIEGSSVRYLYSNRQQQQQQQHQDEPNPQSGSNPPPASPRKKGRKDLPPLFWYMELGDWEKATARAKSHFC